MYCPECRSEFRPDVVRCASCDVELVDAAPENNPFTSPETMARLLEDKDLQAIVVGNFQSVTENQRLLAEERIASVIAPEKEGEEIGAGLHQRLYLLVAQEDLERVRDFFAARLRQGLESEGLMLSSGDSQAATSLEQASTEACPACGTEVSESESECPECGLFLGIAE